MWAGFLAITWILKLIKTEPSFLCRTLSRCNGKSWTRCRARWGTSCFAPCVAVWDSDTRVKKVFQPTRFHPDGQKLRVRNSGTKPTGKTMRRVFQPNHCDAKAICLCLCTLSPIFLTAQTFMHFLWSCWHISLITSRAAANTHLLTLSLMKDARNLLAANTNSMYWQFKKGCNFPCW